jgi:glucuronoarabinoxylan endo-1,4-beta-xylanase
MRKVRWGQTLGLAAAIVLPALAAGPGVPMMTVLAMATDDVAAAAAANITINWNDVRQRIDGFGASSYANLDPGAVMANADLLFDKDKGVGLSLDRMGLPWNPDTGGRPYKCPEIAQLAQARGATVWASNFYPPPEWKSNGSATNGGSLLPERYQDYANLIADSVLDMKSKYGVDVHAVSIQNEPDYAAPWGSATWNADQLKAFVPILANTFSQKGVTSKIMMPEMLKWRFTLADKTMQDPATAKFVGILAAHPYDMPDGWSSPYAGVRPVWMTEHSIGADDDHSIGTAITQALDIHNFMTLAQANAWHAWNLGVILGGKRLYTLGNYSKFVRPGYSRIGVTDDGGVFVSAYKNPSTGDFAIVVVNKEKAQTKTFGLTGFTANNVIPWVTSGTQNLAPQSSIQISGDGFTTTLAGGSVTTFVGRASGTTTPPPSAPAPPTGLRIIR